MKPGDELYPLVKDDKHNDNIWASGFESFDKTHTEVVDIPPTVRSAVLERRKEHESAVEPVGVLTRAQRKKLEDAEMDDPNFIARVLWSDHRPIVADLKVCARLMATIPGV